MFNVRVLPLLFEVSMVLHKVKWHSSVVNRCMCLMTVMEEACVTCIVCDTLVKFVVEKWLVMVNMLSIPNLVFIMCHVFKLMAPDIMFKVTLEVMFCMFVRLHLMMRHIIVVVVYWLMMNLVMRHSIVVVVYWIMTFLLVKMLIVVVCWVDSFVHIVDRVLNRVVMVMTYWLNHNRLVVCVWIHIIVSLVVKWMLQMHLFVVDWIRVVVLSRLDNINKVDLSNIPAWMDFLMVFMLSLRDVMVV